MKEPKKRSETLDFPPASNSSEAAGINASLNSVASVQTPVVSNRMERESGLDLSVSSVSAPLLDVQMSEESEKAKSLESQTLELLNAANAANAAKGTKGKTIIGKRMGVEDAMNSMNSMNSINSINSMNSMNSMEALNSMDAMNSIEPNSPEAEESSQDVVEILSDEDESSHNNSPNEQVEANPSSTAIQSNSLRDSRTFQAARSPNSKPSVPSLNDSKDALSNSTSKPSNLSTISPSSMISDPSTLCESSASSHPFQNVTASNSSSSAPVSTVVNEIASMFLQKDRLIDNLLEEVLQSQPSSVDSSPRPMGKGAFYSPSQVEALTKESANLDYETPDASAPMGFLRTRSTPSLIAAKKMIPPSRIKRTRTETTRGRGRTRQRGRPRGSRSGVRSRRRGKGGVLLSPIGSDDEQSVLSESKATPSEETVKKTREELLLSLRVLSGTQDTATPPSVTRMLNDYNSMLTQEMNQLMIINHMESRGVKRDAPGPYPNNLNDDDVMELRQFVSDNGGNIKKLQRIVSFLEEIDMLGKKAVGRIFPEGEKGGCDARGIQITKESLRHSVYAALFVMSFIIDCSYIRRDKVVPDPSPSQVHQDFCKVLGEQEVDSIQTDFSFKSPLASILLELRENLQSRLTASHVSVPSISLSL